MKPLFRILAFSPLFLINIVFAQDDDIKIDKKSIIFEKVYLHVDRELYAPGDNIWFKSYLVSGVNNQLIPGFKNIYIELISDSGKVISNKLLLSRDGVANGDIRLPKRISDGNYIVRAYTKYLENFGEESYFHKKIMVSKAKNSLELIDELSDKNPKLASIDFLPEGGSLVENAINHIAFKAIDKNGKGIDVKGKIVDETGNEVVSFQSAYKGMGKFIMMPQEGKSYFALIDGNGDFHLQLDKANPTGIALNYKPDGSYLLFTLSRNLKATHSQDFILTASHKGIELFNSKITMDNFQHAQRLYKGLFPLGISKVTVYDMQNNAMAERMVFVQNTNDKKIRLNFDKGEYKTREKVELDITTLLAQNDTITTSLSVAVVHEDYFSATGNNQTIESYLLLDSELKGSIEAPASCFVNADYISADEKLDLVMMINGWRSYYWNDLEKYKGIELPHWDDYGLEVNGQVSKQWGGKPVDNGKVVMGPFSSGFLFEETLTDELGNFKFDRLYLKDSAKIMINAQTKNGSRRTEIKLEPFIKPKISVDKTRLDNVCPDIFVPMKFYRSNYYKSFAERQYNIESGSIMLDEIDIEGQRMDIGDGHFRLYGEADITLEVSEEDMQYFDILDYLKGRVAGLRVDGDEIRIRSASKNPLLLIDGLEVQWDRVREVSMGDIDKIEILKTGFASAVYGSRGGDGVISVLTKMGKGEWENNFERIIHGRITPRLRGFQQPRTFYSPKYDYLNINDPKPDYRPTLVWQPNVKIENGQAKVEFFTADNLARYKVFVEGISKKGRICLGTGLLTVSVPRN